MTKAILLSIHPEWAQKIYSGEKTVEYRKSIPKYNHDIMVYMYETSPVRKVTGFFKMISHFRMDVVEHLVCDKLVARGCLSIQELRHYQNDSKDVVGWVVAGFEKFEQPKQLADFGLKRAPQSWQYVKVKE